jgi:hypothetical protein
MLLKAPDGIVMAADSRVTVGYTLRGPDTKDDSIKFIQLNCDLGVMTYGIFDIGTAGLKALKSEIRTEEETNSDNSKDFSMAEIIDKGKGIFTKAGNDWMRENPNITRREGDVGFIIGGLDRQKMSFKAYNFVSPEFIPQEITGNFFLAGQWHIARFLLTKLDGKKTITIDTLKNLTAVSMIATTAVDDTVGGPLRLATITKPKGFQWVSDEEMEGILDFNRSFHKFFQELLQSSLNAVLKGQQKIENAK